MRRPPIGRNKRPFQDWRGRHISKPSQNTPQVQKMYTVEITVASKKGKCAFGHKVGDKVEFDGRSVSGEICYSALMMLLPKVYALRYGAEFPWAKDKNIIRNACPDATNPVVFKLRRIKK